MRHAIVEEENIPMDTVTNFDEVSISCKIQYCSIDWIGNVPGLSYPKESKIRKLHA